MFIVLEVQHTLSNTLEHTLSNTFPVGRGFYRGYFVHDMFHGKGEIHFSKRLTGREKRKAAEQEEKNRVEAEAEVAFKAAQVAIPLPYSRDVAPLSIIYICPLSVTYTPFCNTCTHM